MYLQKKTEDFLCHILYLNRTILKIDTTYIFLIKISPNTESVRKIFTIASRFAIIKQETLHYIETLLYSSYRINTLAFCLAMKSIRLLLKLKKKIS